MSDEQARKDSGGTWHWAYLIPITALMIPILAVLDLQAADLMPILQIIVGTIAITLGARSVLGYRHKLRMEEIEAQKEIAALESQQLADAQRVLDLDERTQQLREQVRREQAN